VEASAVTCVGKVAISVRLAFDGELDIVWRRRDSAVAELPSVLLDGLLVSQLDKPSPSILTGPTRRFVQRARVFQPPGTMVCRGECAVEISSETFAAQGILGYRLDIAARWTRRAADVAPPESAAQWAEFFGASLASIGGIMLAGNR
jgi:hypothetical protein